MFFLICNPLKLVACAMCRSRMYRSATHRSATHRSATHRSGLLRWALCLGSLLLVVTSSGCRTDSAQWKVAAAANEEANENPEGAIELLQEALRMDPGSDSIKLSLALLLAKNDQGDLSQTLCDEVLENGPENKYAWFVLSECLYSMGRFDEALAAFQKYVAGKIDKGPNELNQLAYFRAIAGVQLDRALLQVNEGIEKSEKQFVPAGRQKFDWFASPPPSWGSFTSVPIEINAIVSAGLLSRYTDEGHLYVMEMLSDRIQEGQQLWLAENAILELLIKTQENQSVDATSQEVEEQEKAVKKASDRLFQDSENLSVLLATRSLIFETQGQTELADLDRLWLKQIDRKPQDIYSSLPNELECIAALSGVEAILDTRGYILTQLPWRPTWTDPSGDVLQLQLQDRGAGISYGSYRLALRDLDLAVAVAEVRLLALNSDAVNRIEYSSESIRYQKVRGTKSIAILRDHRRQAHLKANQIEAAEQDLNRIEELGFDQDDNLF